jgi:hypothetical protein
MAKPSPLRKTSSQTIKLPHTDERTYLICDAVGETGISWKTRNNSIGTHSNFNTRYSIPRKTHSKQLSMILAEDQKSSKQARSMIRSLRDDADTIDQSDKLVTGMHELKRMNLLLERSLQKIKFPGVGKHAHIHNDYHERVTNPGFSRNFLGKFYNK